MAQEANYEQKYRNACKIAKEIINDERNYSHSQLVNEIVGLIFPELKESEDNLIWKDIKRMISNAQQGITPSFNPKDYDKMLSWLENHKECSEERIYPYGDNEIADQLVALAECLEMDGDNLFNGYTGDSCGKLLRELARKEVENNIAQWGEEDEAMLKDAIYFINEFQRSNRCKDENDMQNSVTCENWLKSLQTQPKQE